MPQVGLSECNVLSSAIEIQYCGKQYLCQGLQEASALRRSWTSLLYNSVFLNNAKRQKLMYTSTFVTSLWADNIMVQVVSSITMLSPFSFLVSSNLIYLQLKSLVAFKLPVRISSEEEMEAMMLSALGDSYGFGII